MEKFARVCDITGEGMNEGWVFNDGEGYFKNEIDAINWSIQNGYASLDEAFEDDAIYYTEWEAEVNILEQGYFYNKSGEEFILN